MEQKSAFIKTFPITMFLSIVITIILVLIEKNIGLSFLLGAMTSMMTMSMLYKSSNRLLQMPSELARRTATINYGMRYLLYAIVLVVSGLSSSLNVLVVGIGLLMFKIVLMSMLFLEKRRGGNND